MSPPLDPERRGMPPLLPAPFFSVRNVPFWAFVVLVLIAVAMVAWLA